MAKDTFTPPFTLYDRPRLAGMSLYRGDLGAATRAMFTPDELTPKELEEMKSFFGDSPIGNMLTRTFTNPLFIAGMLMSMKFPIPSMTSLLKISSKFGAYQQPINRMLANISSSRSIFRGTKIPKLMDKIVQKTVQIKEHFIVERADTAVARYRHFMKKLPSRTFTLNVPLKAQEYDKYNSFVNRQIRSEMNKFGIKGFTTLSKPIKLQPAEKPLFKSMKDLIDEFWQKNIAKNKVGLKRVRAVAEAKNIKLGEYNTKYWPRDFNVPGMRSFDLKEGLSAGKKAALQERNLVGKISAHHLPQKGFTIPSMKHLAEQEAAGQLTPGAYKKMEQLLAARYEGVTRKALGLMQKPTSSESLKYFTKRFKFAGLDHKSAAETAEHVMTLSARGETEAAMKLFQTYVPKMQALPQYSLNSFRTIETYFASMAPQVAFTQTGYGAQLLKEMANLDPVRRKFMHDTYLPLLQGDKTPQQIARMIAWGDRKHRIVTWLGKDAVKKYIPKDMHKFLTESLTVGPSGLSRSGPGASIAGYFYLSTLGLNPSPAIKNLMQTFITTDPLLGFRWKWKALGQLTPKVKKYIQLRQSGKLSDIAAMKQAFPEFTKAGLELTPLSETFISGLAGGASDIGNWVIKGTGSTAAMRAESIKRTMMAGFTASERFNRLVTFYAARAKSLSEGAVAAGQVALTGKKLLSRASDHAREIVERTQFPSGLVGTPMGLINRAPYVRQFMHFPLRMVEFLRDSTVLGSAATGTRQWGTLGRALATSVAMYEGAKTAGVNLSEGLVGGALPLPTYSATPFFPFPLVPPAFSILGAGAKAVATGDYSQMGTAGSLLVPGGVALRRGYKALAPQYADYKNRQPNGRIPVYSKNKLLVGQFSPLQLFGRAVGVKSMGDIEEQAMVQYLLKQRDQIREYRRNYLQAMSVNNLEKARAIAEDFEKRYPGMGGLQMKKNDMKSLMERRTVSRVNRIMKGFPKQYQPYFQEAVNTSLAQRIVSDLERGPEFASDAWQLPQQPTELQMSPGIFR